MQVPSPAAGVIEELLVPDGGKVEGGTPLFKLRKGGCYYHIFNFNFVSACISKIRDLRALFSPHYPSNLFYIEYPPIPSPHTHVCRD